MEDIEVLKKGSQSFLRWFPHLSPADQQEALAAKGPSDLNRIAGSGAYEDLEAFRKLQAQGLAHLPQTSSTTSGPSRAGDVAGSAIGGAGLAAAGGIKGLTEDKSYEGRQKSLEKMKEEAGKDYAKLQEELRKHPPKKPDPDMFQSKDEYIEYRTAASHDFFVADDPKKAKKWAQEHPEDIDLNQAVDRAEIFKKNLTFEEYEAARKRYIERAALKGAEPNQIAELQAKASRDFNNLLVRTNPDLAKKFAIEHGDQSLANAYNADRQRKIDEARKNQSRISKLLGKDPSKKFGEEIKITEQTAPAPNTLSKQAAPNTLTAQATPNTLSHSSSPNTLSQNSQPHQPPNPTPAQTPGSRGRRALPGASKAKRVAGAAALASRLAAGDWTAWLQVLKYLLPILLGAIILFIGLIFYLWVEACNIAAQYPFGTDIVRAFGLTCDFGNPDDGSGDYVPPPPPGFTIVKKAPDTSDPSVPIAYTIEITYDPDKADPGLPLDEMTLVDSPDFTFTNPESTDAFTQTGQNLRWKLSDFISNSRRNYTFRFSVTPTSTGLLANNAWIEAPNGTGTRPKPCAGDIKQCLKEEFNIIAEGNPPESFLEDVYTLYSEIAVATKYKQLLNAGDPTHLFFSNEGDVDCLGRVRNTLSRGSYYTTLTLYDWSLNNSVCSRRTRKSRLAHESGHWIKNMPGARYEYYKENIYNNDNGCYYRDNNYTRPFFLNTYVVGYGEGLQGENESFAESIANYVLPETKNGRNYMADCPNALEFIRDTIFNGYKY